MWPDWNQMLQCYSWIIFRSTVFLQQIFHFFMPNLNFFGICTALRVMASPLMPANLTSGLVQTLRMSEMILREAPVLKLLRHKKWKMGCKTVLLKMICLYCIARVVVYLMFCMFITDHWSKIPGTLSFNFHLSVTTFSRRVKTKASTWASQKRGLNRLVAWHNLHTSYFLLYRA